jgi:hypothetical protein
VAREFGCGSPTGAFPRERGNGEQGECINSIRTKAVADLPKLRQLRDIRRDPPRFVAREQLGRFNVSGSNPRSRKKAEYAGIRRYAPWIIPEPNYCLAKLVRS